MSIAYRWCLSILALILLALSGSARPVNARPAPTAAPIPASSPTSLPPFQPCHRGLAGATTASATDTVVATCRLMLGSAATLVLLADGSMDEGGEARLRLAVDGAPVLTHYADRPTEVQAFGMRSAVAVAAGPHTVTLTMARQQGASAVKLGQGTLLVMAIGSDRTDMRACGGMNPTPPTTTSEAGYITLVSCAIQAPSAGSVLILASANQYLVNSGVRANYRVGEPGVSTRDHSDRLVDVQTNGADGTDVSLTTMGRMEVAAGQTLEVGLVVKRTAGTGTVGVRQASVIGLFLPSGGPIDWCAHLTNAVVAGEQNVAACTFQVRASGSLLLISDMSVDKQPTTWNRLYSETSLTVGAVVVRRDLWKDSFDALSAPATGITPVAPGPATARVFVGTDGPALDVDLMDAGLIALVLPGSTRYIPAIMR